MNTKPTDEPKKDDEKKEQEFACVHSVIEFEEESVEEYLIRYQPQFIFA